MEYVMEIIGALMLSVYLGGVTFLVIYNIIKFKNRKPNNGLELIKGDLGQDEN